jgi:NADH-quinone oxidoreductase subunit L
MPTQNLWLIPALPFLGFLINGIFGRKLSKSLINFIAVASVVLSFGWVMKVFMTAGDLSTAPVTEHYFTWIKSGAFQVGWDFTVDKLTMIMLMIVTGIGSLIHIYATGYMAHEEGYYRFFAYLNLFMFFMLNLVLAANYLILFVGWEGVGLCSYLLIGFYFVKKSATTAGNKAFIVNRIGDFGFSLAMFLIVVNFGSLDFTQVFSAAPGKPTATLTAIALLLLVGACGKSAQIPLYVWLPDAMEGPTPVSALIHAATMVTAGVYMCARSAAIFTHAPIAMETVAMIGLATAVFAATIGLAQNDIKNRLATRLHVPRCWRGRILRRHLAPDDARVFQSAAVPRRWQRDSCLPRRTGHAAYGWPEKVRAVDLSHARVRIACHLRLPLYLGLLQ